jgi:hypothetical protein
MNQIAAAAEYALATCPKTSWQAEPICDYSGQRISFAGMKGQLIEQANKARARLFVMLIHWGHTGTWPNFRNEPVYFLREILQNAAARKDFAAEDDFPESPPPWPSKYVARFFDRTALVWYLIECDTWARDLASEHFDLQESQFKQMHPLE